MNDDQNIYQAPDFQVQNPLEPASAKSKTKFTIPKDPKILSLIIMGIIIVVLFLVAIIVSIFRSNSNSIVKITPTPTPQIQNTPTPAPASNLPPEIKTLIDQINQSKNLKELPPPPQIDDTIGL